MTRTDYKNQIVWIIGASSGIGESLAHELARRGATVALSARRLDELQTLKNSLVTESGQKHHAIYPLDIADNEAVVKAVHSIITDFGRIDCVVFLAAIYAPRTVATLDIQTIRTMVDINLMGAFHLLHALYPVLKKQKDGGMKGQIALCGSVAGYIGLPAGQPYSATKAAIINLAETLYAEWHDDIDVKLISPGFVRTPLTAKNDFAMPMMIEPETAATAIADGLLSSSFEIHFPKKFTMFLKLLKLLPYALSLAITRAIKH